MTSAASDFFRLLSGLVEEPAVVGVVGLALVLIWEMYWSIILVTVTYEQEYIIIILEQKKGKMGRYKV